jgi:hypothetical protein
MNPKNLAMVRTIVLSIVLGFQVLGSSASQVDGVALRELRGVALAELAWLGNDAPEHAALIFQAEESKALVQFSGRELSLDMPQERLSENQLEKATSLLLPIGVETFSYPVGRGASQRLQYSFFRNFRGDSLEAWDAVQLIFRKVYELDEDARIVVTRIQ